VACVTQRSKAMEATTDEKGRYRIIGAPKQKNYTISIGGKKRFPYLDYTRHDVPDTPGLVPLEVDLEVDRGVEITGRVLSRDGRKGLRGQVHYFDIPDNPHVKDYPTLKGLKHLVSDWGSIGPDGRFRVVGIPGQGLLVVVAEDQQGYAQVETWRKMLIDFKVNPIRTAHAVVAIEPPDRPGAFETKDILLDRGGQVSGKVVGPDGKPVAGAIVAGLRNPSDLVEQPMKERSGLTRVSALKGSTFTARAIGPEDQATLVFYHADKKLARVFGLRNKEANPGEVKLEPCGTLAGRVVDEKGVALASQTIHVQWRLKPEEAVKQGLPIGELNETGLMRLLQQEVRSDEKGKFRVEGLFPGLVYELFIVEAGGSRALHITRGLRFEPGKVRDLGDLKPNLVPMKRGK
jgi:hypothetical protein